MDELDVLGDIHGAVDGTQGIVAVVHGGQAKRAHDQHAFVVHHELVDAPFPMVHL